MHAQIPVQAGRLGGYSLNRAHPDNPPNRVRGLTLPPPDPKTILLVGSTGFVGRNTAACLLAAGHRVVGTSTDGHDADLAFELGHPESADRVLAVSKPDAILIVAGKASVTGSWQNPTVAFGTNITGPFILLDAVRRRSPDAHVIFVSSAAAYGSPASPESMPFTEDDLLLPNSPYGASKAAAEMFCQQFGRQGMTVTIARLFNQIGPGQSDTQAPAEFSREIAEAERRGDARLSLPVGDPSVRRDFTDMRDTAEAFRRLIENRASGTFNLCSGVGVSLKTIIEELAGNTDVEVEIAPRKGPPRPVDIPSVYGSYDRLNEKTGWQPVTPLAASLADLLADWRNRI